MDRELIDHYEAGGEKLSLAIRGLTREDLLCVPDPAANVGKWSIQQVVIHCMDSDLVSIDRMKRMIAEDNPTLIGYDENKFVANLFYDEQPAEDAVTIVDAEPQARSPRCCASSRPPRSTAPARTTSAAGSRSAATSRRRSTTWTTT